MDRYPDLYAYFQSMNPFTVTVKNDCLLLNVEVT